jgi:ring-1,2-phenylacetyl-CoA epoxidase subunit PaaD
MVMRSLDTAPAAPTRDDIVRLLDTVMDPELPAISITDLGIVRDVRVEGDTVTVALTPTYSGCPATEVIAADVTHALHENGIANVRIERRLAPAWTTDWITPRGRERLKQHGIAPPADTRCPQCGSPNVEEFARFGSTPCKALYRCNACREPFDYVKPH